MEPSQPSNLEDLNFILKDALDRLEWAKICQSVAQHAVLTEVKVRFENLVPWVSQEQRYQRLMAAMEGSKLVMEGKSLQKYSDFEPKDLLVQIKRENSLSKALCVHLLLMLNAAKEISHFFPDPSDKLKSPVLAKVQAEMMVPSSFHAAVRSTIDLEGEILDSASSELKNLRQKQKNLKSKIESTLGDLIKKTNFRNALQDAQWSIRDGRYVVPVRTDRKSEIVGTTLGVSSTGHTLFIEPAEMTGLQGQLEETQTQIWAEEARILHALSKQAWPLYDTLVDLAEGVYKWDFYASLSLFSLSIDGCCPEFHQNSQDPKFEILGARHPFLVLDRKTVVANDLILNSHRDSQGSSPQVWVLSGPNAGGKTLSMKTVGLLFVMAQAGLAVSARSARFHEFNQVFAEIGDRQNVSEDLSTFSGHLTHLKKICSFSQSRTLVLLDEGFVGTDPALGTALARATLEYLADVGATVIITTHFSSLKLLSNEDSRFVNASMEFENSQLLPTYRLLPGIPGQSFALELASRIGFFPSIIEKAKEYHGKEERNLEKLLQTLQIQREELDHRLEQNKLWNQQLLEEKEKLERSRKELTQLRDDLVTSYQSKLEKRLNSFVNRLEIREKQFLKHLESQRKNLAESSISTVHSADLSPESPPLPVVPSPSKQPVKSKVLGLQDLAQFKSKLPAKNPGKEEEDEITSFRSPKQFSVRSLRDEAVESLENLKSYGDKANAEMSKELNTLAQMYGENSQRALPEIPKVAPGIPAFNELKKGDKVKSQKFKETGIVLADSNYHKGMIEVQFGILKIKLKWDEVTLIPQTDYKKQLPPNKVNSVTTPKSFKQNSTSNQTDMQIPQILPYKGNTIDLRGMMVEESIEKCEAFVSHCYSQEISPFVILHGHGTGKVKLAVREWLQKHSWKLRFRPGTSGEGSDGVTIVAIDET